MEDKNRQTVMYLEAIQKLSMFIVRQQKLEPGKAQERADALSNQDSGSVVLD